MITFRGADEAPAVNGVGDDVGPEAPAQAATTAATPAIARDERRRVGVNRERACPLRSAREAIGGASRNERSHVAEPDEADDADEANEADADAGVERTGCTAQSCGTTALRPQRGINLDTAPVRSYGARHSRASVRPRRNAAARSVRDEEPIRA